MSDELVKGKNRSKRRRDARRKKRQMQRKEQAAAAGAPKGYMPIPGSKTGGYRKRVGGEWVYWYPDKAAVRSAGHAIPDEIIPSEAEGERVQADFSQAISGAVSAAEKLGAILGAAGTSMFEKARKLGEWHKKHHHKIEEAVELGHIAEVWFVHHGATAQKMLTTAMAMGGADEGGERLEPSFKKLVSKAYQSHTNEPKVGDKIENTNKKCKHFGSKGTVTGVKALPGDKGKVISYKCENDGKSWKKGDVLKKTPDQLSPMSKGAHMNFSDLLSKAAGGQKAGHKYKSRKPDGKGGFLYDYGDGKGFRKPSGKVKEDGKVSEAESNLLEAYNMECVGKDKEKAAYIAQKVKEGIEKAADVCQMSPPVCKGNKGIPRSEMPQLLDESFDKLREKGQGWKVDAAIKAGADPNMKGTMFDAFIDSLEKKGVRIGSQKEPYEQVNVGELKATQREIKAEKTFGMADAHLKGKFNPGKSPIVISKDGFILDGHHRFAAMTTIAPDRKMNVIRVDMDMDDMLGESFKMPGVFRADLQDNVVEGGTPDRFKDSGLSDATYDTLDGDKKEWLRESGYFDPDATEKENREEYNRASAEEWLRESGFYNVQEDEETEKSMTFSGIWKGYQGKRIIPSR